MIFGFDGQAFHRRVKRWPFWHRPRFQYAVHLQAEVVMKAGRVMPLDYKTIMLRGGTAAPRLGTFAEWPFFSVFPQRIHSMIICRATPGMQTAKLSSGEFAGRLHGFME